MARLPIKLQPGASRDRIEGWEHDPEGRSVLKVRVRARPVDGEANTALLLFLAKALRTPKAAVALARGGQSRLKMIEVDGMDDAELKMRLDGIIEAG